jgi:gentisate 1,2-dioxygenase
MRDRTAGCAKRLNGRGGGIMTKPNPNPNLHYKALTSEAQYFDYASAANPLQAKLITPVPYRAFSPDFFYSGPSRVQPLDLSEELGCSRPASSPALCANFVRIAHGSLQTSAVATSQIFYIFRGEGRTDVEGESIFWQAGDFLALPPHGQATHHCDGEAGMYWIHDAPLLRYLGVAPTEKRFSPTLFEHGKTQAKLAQIEADPKMSQANRVSVLLANSHFPQTRTITHTLWAMYGVLPAGKVQFPHRHESVALDFVVDCKPGCYTLIGTELGEDGFIKNAHREDWQPGASFVTPPGYWHAHYNESGVDAHVLPIQDAGLHSFLRTLEITLSHPGHDRTSYISQKQ